MQIELFTPEKITTVVAVAAAAYERFISQRKKKQTEAELALLSDAKLYQERATMLAKLADDNAQLFQAEHMDHQKTRDYWHNKATEFQGTLSACQEKLISYEARPDYSELAHMMEKVVTTSQNTLTAIHEVVTLLREQIQRTPPQKPNI